MSELELHRNQAVAAQEQTQYFDLIVRQADVLAQSNILPSAYRRRSADIIAAGLAGRAFGWDVMTSLNNYHVIEGTASLKPEAMLGLVRRAGHSVTLAFHENNVGKYAEARGKRADNGDEHTARFSSADANRAGLANKKNWQQYEEAMLTWRAVSALCRVLFPDVVMGAGYTPEEIGGPVATPDEDDPLAEVYVHPTQAKRALLEACGNNRGRAIRLWAERGSEPIKHEELEFLLAEARQYTEDIEEAVIVEPEAIEAAKQAHPTAKKRAQLGSAANKENTENDNQN